MKTFIILLLALTIVANGKSISNKETIEEFIKYLEETKLYDIFYQIKKVLGNEAAFFTCEEFLYNSHCEESIIVYMPPISKMRNLASIIFERLNEILFNEDNLKILKNNNIDEKTIKDVILRVEKRFQK